MAISKILYIGACGAGHPGKHLKHALDYITEEHKTGGGRWISSLNCQADHAYEQMQQTKIQFGKTNQRQGYHLIISFEEGEVDVQTAFEVIGKFAKEYLGQDYEVLYSVHDNTDHIHGHIIFNSVSFRTGKKYRYEKGDWARQIQPITNRLCEEYGLSTIEISEDRARPSDNYTEWNDFRDGKFVWADMIKRDIDACILQAATYESFLSMLSEMGYGIKNADRTEGKYLAIKPMGLTRFRRCKTLGAEYSEERIRERILTENLSAYRNTKKQQVPRIVRCRVKHYKRAKLSSLQKSYYAKLYRLGRLKKKPYSQAWKYRDDIRKMAKLQEDYLFLVEHNVRVTADVALLAEGMAEKKKETSREKSRIFKERAKMKPLFDMARELRELEDLESGFMRGEELFEPEHERYLQLQNRLKKEGYLVEQLEEFKLYYQNEIAMIREKERVVFKEEKIAKRILAELMIHGTESTLDRKGIAEKKENKESERSRIKNKEIENEKLENKKENRNAERGQPML